MDHPLTLPELALAAARRLGDRPVYTRWGAERESLSFAQLAAAAASGARGFAALDVRPGERWGLVARPGPSWVVSVLAAHWRGASITPMDPEQEPSEVADLLRGLGVRRVLTDAHESHARALSKAGLEAHVLRGPGSLLARSDGATPLSPIATAEDEALVLHTSGTGGRPQAISLSHAAFLAEAKACSDLAPPKLVQRGLALIPPWHVLGFNLLIPLALQAGTHVAFPEALDRDSLSAAFRGHRPTVLGVVPAIAERLVAVVENRVAESGRMARASVSSARSLRDRLPAPWGDRLANALLTPVRAPLGGRLSLLISSGAAMDQRLLPVLRGLGIRVVEAYGLTETCGAVTATELRSPGQGAAGRALPGVRLRIDRPGETGQGEVLVQAPMLATGLPRERMTDRWLRTGDRGRLESDGTLSLDGRLSDTVVLASGRKVSPEAVERRLGRLPLVDELAVCSVSMDGADEVALVVVPSDPAAMKASPSQRRLRTALAEAGARLQPHERPRHLRVAPEPLPRTAGSKLQRRKLAALLLDADWGHALSLDRATTSAPIAAASESALAVLAAARERLGFEPDVEASLSLELGLSSLDRVELVAEVERRLGRSSPAHARRAETLADLITAVETASTGQHGSLLRPPSPDELAFACRSRRIADAALPLTDSAFSLLGRLARWGWRLRVEGVERLPESGPLVLCANHLSAADSFLIPASVPAALRRRLFILGHADLHDRAMASFLLRSFRSLPLDDGGDPLPGLRTALRLLDDGGSVLVYPEGGRSRDGELGPFGEGAALLALAAGASIVPVTVSGSADALPIDSLRPRRRRANGSPVRVTIRFGAPFEIERCAEDDLRAQRLRAGELTARLRGRLDLSLRTDSPTIGLPA